MREDVFPVRLVYVDTPAFAKGGLVDAALMVKRAGRYGDSEIIHINREELRELKRAWGKPTINPETGMPEFFLKKIGKVLKKALPVAALAANFIPGVGPLVSAGLGAAGALLNKQGVGGALMAAAPGMLGGGFQKLGIPLGTTPTFGKQPAAQVGEAVAANTAGAATPQPTPIAGNASTDMLSGGSSTDTLGGVTQQPTPAKQPNWFNQETFKNTGIKNKHLLIGGALGAAMLAGGKKNSKASMPSQEEFFGSSFSGGLPASNLGTGAGRGYQAAPAGYRPGYDPEFNHFYPKTMAEGGSLAVEGPGDGREDKIEALLSDGEYVMDAETVAMLGNGSNKAGAKALDAMRVNLRRHKGRNLAKGSLSVKAKRPESYMRGHA